MGSDETPELVCMELLRRTASGWSLLGGRCASCGEIFFPAQRSCASCCSTSMLVCELGDHGVLWSWTIQSFLPKSPYDSREAEANFRPYGVGYVQLPCGLKVESRLTVSDPDRLQIGAPMGLTLEPYRTEPDGQKVFTFAFQPLA
jgi:uncharacterized protein